MNELNSLDYTIILIYLFIVLSVGFIYRKAASGSLENYFLGGRRLPWWLLGTSGMAHYLDMTGTMLIVSFLYMLGPRGLFIEFRGGACLGLAFCLCWTGKWHRRSGCITNAEWMAYRFGSGPGGNAARLFTAISGLIMTVGIIAYLAKGAGLFLSMFVPFSPMVSALILLSIATMYTMSAGFLGVVMTDLIQSIIIIAAVCFISILALSRILECSDFTTIAETVTGNTQWIDTMPTWRVTMPTGYEPYQMLGMFALFYLLRNMIGGMGTGDDPKFFAARSDRECGKLSFLWIVLIMLRWPMMIAFAVLGIFLVHDIFPDQAVLSDAATLIKQFHPETTKILWPDLLAGIANSPQNFDPNLVSGLKTTLGADWIRDLSFVSFEGTVNPERILPAVLLFQIPPGLRGLLIVAMIAAAMSSFDSELNRSCALFVRDIYQRFIRPHAQVNELLRVSKLTCITIVAAGFAMTYTTKSINDIWGWIVMGLGGGSIAPIVLRFYWWRFNGTGFATGIGAGLTCALIQRFLWPDTLEWQQFIILSCISFICSVVGTLLTPPTDKKILEHFYHTTRPFGFWGPFKAALESKQRIAYTREHRNDITAVFFALVWQITLFLLPMQLMIHAYGDMMKTGVAFAIGALGLYWFWYRNLPQDRPDTTSETSSHVQTANETISK